MVINELVLAVFEQFSSYSILGKPNVTFRSDIPAKWKVFNVICVVGSPID